MNLIEGEYVYQHDWRGRLRCVRGRFASLQFLVEAPRRGRSGRCLTLKKRPLVDSGVQDLNVETRVLADIVRYLEGPEATDGSIRAALAIREMAGAAELTRELDAVLPRWSFGDVTWFSAPRGVGRRRLEAFRAAPAVALIVPAGSARVDPFDFARGLATGEGRRRPSDARIRRVISDPEIPPFTSADQLEALLALPEEWTPRTSREWNGFRRFVTVTKPIRVALGDWTHLEAYGGDWSRGAWDDGARDQTLPNEAGQDVVDMVRAFEREVVLPALARRGIATDDETVTAWLVTRPTPSLMTAAELLLRGKGFPAMTELSRRWHRRRQAIEEAIRPGQAEGGSWPVPFVPVTEPDGIRLVALATPDELRAEGHDGPLDGVAGLAHCVSGYAGDCDSGMCVIVSLRRVDAKGGFVRLATLQLVPPIPGISGWKVAQLRGHRNAAPTPEAEAAARRLAKGLTSGEIPTLPAWNEQAWPRRRVAVPVPPRDPFDEAAFDVALEAWTPLLRRPLRTAAGFEAGLLRAADAVAGARLPRGRKDLVAGCAFPRGWSDSAVAGYRPQGISRDRFLATAEAAFEAVAAGRPFLRRSRTGRIVRAAWIAALTLAATVPLFVVTVVSMIAAAGIGIFGREMPWSVAIGLSVLLVPVLTASMRGLQRGLEALGARWWRRRVAEAAMRAAEV